MSARPRRVRTQLWDAGRRPVAHFLYRDDLPAGVLDAAAVHPTN